jgi:membrane dipeptidase
MKYVLVALLSILVLSCQSPQKKEEAKSEEEAEYAQKAQLLANKFIITDGHIDLPYRLKSEDFDIEEDKDLLISTEEGDFDYERAKKGGLDAPFMSIYIPAIYQETGGAKELADSLINLVESITQAFPDKFAMASSPQDVEENFKAGKISLPMGMENGAPIEDDLANVKYFYERGIRYITLTHSKNNLIGDSSYDTTRTWNGLSPFGREVVAEMNKVGIMVDVSHISDSTFYQVMEITKAPVIASHSSCRHFTPDFERNMNDAMIKRLGENGGVMQINFGSTFLDGESQKVRKHVRDYIAENEWDSDDPKAQAYRDKYFEENSFFSSVQKVADHIDRVVELAGINHVGLGSDFDGVGDSLPIGLKDVSMYPNLIEELLKRGYSEEDIEKICYKNVFRVWNKVQEVAG